MREINVIYCQLDSGGEEQRQTRQGLCFPLSSAALCPSHQIPTPPPGQQDSSSSPQLLPAQDPPCSGMVFSHGMQSFRKTKMLKSMGSPQAVVPSGLSTCFCVGSSSHPVSVCWLLLPSSPSFVHCRFLWSNPLLCSTESNRTLICVCD